MSCDKQIIGGEIMEEWNLKDKEVVGSSEFDNLVYKKADIEKLKQELISNLWNYLISQEGDEVKDGIVYWEGYIYKEDIEKIINMIFGVD